MTVNWNDYQRLDLDVAFKSKISSQFKALPRDGAERIYSKLMTEKTQRKAMLEALLGANGVELSCSKQDLIAVNDWFFRHATSREDRATDISPTWYSVAIDLALFLGDCIIASAPHLHWELCVESPKSIAYHMPVVAGFRNVSSDGFYIELIRPIAGIGIRGLGYTTPERVLASLPDDMQQRRYRKRLKEYRAKDAAGEPLDTTMVGLCGCLEYA